MKKILIVDDDKNVQTALTNLFKYKNYNPKAVSDAKSAIEELKKYRYDIVFLDIRLPDDDGISCLKQIKQLDEDIPVVILTAYGDIKQAVSAMKLGACDYLTKPVSNDELLLITENILKQSDLQKELWYLREKFYDSDIEIVYKSDLMKEVVNEAIKIAKTDYNVLITGETGVGKELIAKFIHRNSIRRSGMFVVIDCGTLPETLIETELFGYEKGAFTDATTKKLGKIELADKGTLFLDEITNLPLHLQTKFLRVVEQKEFYRVGGTSLIGVDVRFIAATNLPIEELVQKDKFRKDLYYRLNECRIIVPPLRERPEDIIPLTEYFLKKITSELGKTIKGITEEAKDLLLSYQWPGNVRQLYNVVKTAALFATDFIDIFHLQKVLFHDSAEYNEIKNFNLNHNIESIEKNLIKYALQKTGYNKFETAKLLGISRKTLYKKLQKYKIKV